jgi:hypothetical protein
MYIDTLAMTYGTQSLLGGLSTGGGSFAGRSSVGGATFAVGQTSIGREEIETFAAEIRRRADLGNTETDGAAADQGAAAGDSADDTDAKGAALASSLAGAVDYIREEYGSDAATAAMGLVLQNVGDGALTEENLSDGLVAALKFIDKNLGTAAGDRVMARFNGSLNDAMNRYFENGSEELFVAVENGVASFGTGVAAPAAQTTQTGDEDSASSVEDGILAMLKEISILRDADNARADGAATAADPYAAYQTSYLQTSGMLLDAAV